MATLTSSIVSGSVAGNRRNSLILLGLIAAVLALFGPAIIDQLRGPQAFDQAALLAGRPQDGYVSLPFNGRLLETGVRETTTTRTRRGGTSTRTDYYRLLPVGDRFLIVQSDAATAGAGVIGEFMTAESEFDRTRVIPALERAAPQARGRILASKLYSNQAVSFGTVGMVVLAVLGALLAWQLSKWLGVARDPLRHPLIRSLAGYGDAQQLAAQIDAEAGPAQTRAPALTANWLVTPDRALRLHDAVWAYVDAVTSGKTRIVSHHVHVYDRLGNHAVISTGTSQQHAGEWLQALAQRAPWLTTGHSDDLHKLWREDRNAFVAAVDLRRAGHA